MKLILKIVAVAVAVWVATLLVDGVTVTAETTSAQIGTLLVVALIFGLVNAVIKPIIQTIGCAFYVLTLGLFALVVNAALLWLTSWVSDKLDVPFHVSGFWPAFWGAIVIGVVTWVLDLIFGD